MNNLSWSACHSDVPLKIPALESLENIDQLLVAAQKVQECQRLLAKAGINVVSELLRGQGTFYEFSHYPKDDVYDSETHSQYYYHNHRGLNNEHGHFHTFVRAQSIPETIKPMDGFMRTQPWPLGDDALAHLMCISMDESGFPIGLFATNRWVTGQTWYSAADTISLLDRFQIDHAYPNLAVNQWISALFVLFRPLIVTLLQHRDKVIEVMQAKQTNNDIIEDRSLEVTGSFSITVDEWITQLKSLS